MHDDPDTDNPNNSLKAATNELARGYKKEKSAAKRVLHDAQDAVTQKASEVATEAKDALLGQAADKQKDIGASLGAFGGALRAASDHLANSDQRSAATMMLDAAGGLERLSSSLRSKPIEEVLGELRDYGRNNTTALMVGSVVAGLALGRFLKSTSAGDENPEARSDSDESREDRTASRWERTAGQDAGRSEGFSLGSEGGRYD